MTVRTRYAPSPTGSPHLGNIRTALFSWLFARHHGGQFVLRIEDTDQKREKENGLPDILESLEWLGIDWDEGPYKQSERLDIYQLYAASLVATGLAYHCFCTNEELSKNTHGYNRKCRAIWPVEMSRRVKSGEKSVIRLKVPIEGATTYHDVLHGDITFANKDIDDQVLLKSDGFPTYHLAVVVDDHMMGITHVIRGDDWISSGPKHALLYRYFGWEMPILAQLPMVLGPDKSKLSKRHGDTSILEFKNKGYLPEAILNFLARLGWSLDDKTEIFSKEELIRDFSLEKCSSSGAVVDVQRLDFLNKHYMKQLSWYEFASRLSIFMNNKPLQIIGTDLIKDRVKTLAEAETLYNMFDSECVHDGKFDTNVHFRIVRGQLSDLDDFSAKNIENVLRTSATQLGVKLKDLAPMIGEALTGSKVTPPLFQMMEIIGKDKVMRRIGGHS